MKLTRQEFLDEFLGALGARSVDYTIIQDDVIAGFVTYDPSDPDPNERQDFRWRASQSDVPSPVAFDLIKIINRDKLLYIDQLTVTEEVLFSRLGGKVTKEEFEQGLEEILSIKISMVDDGEETDAYIIHQQEIEQTMDLNRPFATQPPINLSSITR